MLNSLTHRQIEHRHGSLLALSHAFHRKIGHLRKASTFDENAMFEWAELKQVVNLLIEHLNDQQPLLVSAAINGISFIGSVVKLPLAARPASRETSSTKSYDVDEKMDVDDDQTEYTKEYVGHKLLFLLKSAHSRPKIREEAAQSLGHLAIGDGAYFAQGNLNAFSNLIKLVRVKSEQLFHCSVIIF